MGMRVNGVEIGDDRIREEMQYHPASSMEAARDAATDALMVRALLIEEAKRLGIASPEPVFDASRKLIEAPEEALIRGLIEREVRAPEPAEEVCRQYYAEHPSSFRSPDLLLAAHILFAARPGDEAGIARAKSKAAAALQELERNPDRFAELARELSDCSSGKHGGDLGQITRGSTVPELETFLFALEPGQICPVPIQTRYGIHVARLDRRLDGRQLPYAAVKERILVYLRERFWQEAVRTYIGHLVAVARIERSEGPAPTEDTCGAGCGCGASAK